MKLDQSIIWILGVTFLLGVVLAFVADPSHNTLTIEVVGDDGMLADSMLNTCDQYLFKIATPDDRSFKRDHIKWRVDDQWRSEEVAEIEFLSEGKKRVELFVNGKRRADTVMTVHSCATASLIAPDKIIKGEEHILKDQTSDAIAWQWYMNGDLMEDEDGKDDQLTYEFRRAATYDLRLVVTTSDGENRSTSRTLHVEDVEVEPVRRPSRPTYTSTSPVPRPSSSHQTTSPITERPSEPQTQVPNEPVVTSPEPVSTPVGMAFGDYLEEDFSQRENLLYVTKTKGCADFNGEVSVVYISEVTTDLCLTYISLLPDPNMKGNEVEIVIANSNPSKGRPRKISRVVQASKNPTAVLVESIGCGLLKGERYTITVRPKGESKFGEVGSGSSCYDTRTGTQHASIDVGDKSKILGLTFKHN